MKIAAVAIAIGLILSIACFVGIIFCIIMEYLEKKNIIKHIKDRKHHIKIICDD